MAENETVTEQHIHRKVFFFWGVGGGGNRTVFV